MLVFLSTPALAFGIAVTTSTRLAGVSSASVSENLPFKMLCRFCVAPSETVNEAAAVEGASFTLVTTILIVFGALSTPPPSVNFSVNLSVAALGSLFALWK